MGKSVLVGALIAILLVVVVGLGGYLFLQDGGGASSEGLQDRVVLVFESPAEDGATVAALITLVVDGRMRDVSPDTTVTIPGTSHSRLGDAFVFGGGASVLSALGDGQGVPPTAFVTVPESVWHAAVDATGGVQVDIPTDITVFDGSRLTTIRSGEQTLTAAGVGALLRGLPYVSAEGRSALRRGLERQLASAVVAARPGADQLDSDLPPESLVAWLQANLSRAVISQVE